MAEPTPPTTVRYCARHPETETRLSCAQCETLICPRCMVMCDVGIKCPDCVRGTESHITQVSNRHLAAAFALAFFAGLTYSFFEGWLMAFPVLHIFGIPIVGLFLAYLTGKGLGSLIRRLIGYKLGKRISLATTLGVLIGIVAGPFHEVVFTMIMIINAAVDTTQPSTSAIFMMAGLMIHLFGAFVFIRGLQSTFWRL